LTPSATVLHDPLLLRRWLLRLASGPAAGSSPHFHEAAHSVIAWAFGFEVGAASIRPIPGVCDGWSSSSISPIKDESPEEIEAEKRERPGLSDTRLMLVTMMLASEKPVGARAMRIELRSLRVEASGLVNRFWEIIRDLAWQLIERGVMTGPEVRACIADSSKRYSLPPIAERWFLRDRAATPAQDAVQQSTVHYGANA